MEVEGGFEVKVGYSWPLLVELGGLRLFALDTGKCQGFYSEDGGRTWGEPCEIRQAGGEALTDNEEVPAGDVGWLAPTKGSITAVGRFASGTLGALYVDRRQNDADKYRHNAGNGTRYTSFLNGMSHLKVVGLWSKVNSIPSVCQG